MTTAINSGWCALSPQSLTEGEEPVYSMTVPGVTTVTNDATLTMVIYRGNADMSATCLSGSISSAGNVVTCKKIASLVGKSTYVVTVKGTADGILRVLGKFQIDCQRLGQTQ
jgi:hypothetical protein